MDTQEYRRFVEVLKHARNEVADVAARTQDKSVADDLRRVTAKLDKAIDAYSEKMTSHHL